MGTEIGAHYAVGSWGRIVPVRLRTHTDVFEGINGNCEAEGIKQGAVLTGIGSVRKLTYQVLVPKPDTKLGAGYAEPMEVSGPVEIASLSGVIFQSEDGELLLHLHGTFSDRNGGVLAGHLVAGGNPVLATLEAVIVEVSGASMIRQMDEQVGMQLVTPR